VAGTVNVTIDTTGATSLTDGGSYNLITAASGLTTGAPTWQFTGGGTTKTVSVGGNNYRLTLNTSDTAISVSVAQFYNVTYDGNGKDGGGAPPTDGSNPYISGATVTVLGNVNGMAKSGGYTFKRLEHGDGWHRHWLCCREYVRHHGQQDVVCAMASVPAASTRSGHVPERGSAPPTARRPVRRAFPFPAPD